MAKGRMGSVHILPLPVAGPTPHWRASVPTDGGGRDLELERLKKKVVGEGKEGSSHGPCYICRQWGHYHEIVH